MQVEAVLRGELPATDRPAWGYEDESRWGTLALRGTAPRRGPSAQGDYTWFYDTFAEVVASGEPGPVPGPEGVAALRVLDAARASAAEGRTVTVSPDT